MKNGWPSVLAAVANACCGEDGCCGLRDADGSCCMTRHARDVLATVEAAGGPSLSEMEAMAVGEMTTAETNTTKLIAAVADACANGCSECVDPGEPCCMTDQAREVFRLIEYAGGPSLEQCEAISRGEAVVERKVKVGHVG